MSQSVRAGRAWMTFAAVAILWGIPYLWIKIVVDEGVSPAFLAWVRIVLGAAVLLVLAGRAGTLGGLRGRWRWLVLFALTELAVPFPLIAAGEAHRPDGGRPGPRRDLRESGGGRLAGRRGPRRAPGIGSMAGLVLILAGSWLATAPPVPMDPPRHPLDGPPPEA